MPLESHYSDSSKQEVLEDSKETFVTLCMPSHRNYAESKNSISSVVSFCELTNFNLHISDNSGCSQKEKWLKSIDNDRISLSFGPCSEVENWMRSTSGVYTKYIGFVADDDLLVGLENITGHDVFKQDYSGIIPNVILFNQKLGAYNLNKISAESESKKERSLQLSETQKPSNSSLFGWFLRDEFMSLVTRSSKLPLAGVGVQDWALTSIMAGHGKVYCFNEAIYIYNNQHWVGTQEFVNENLISRYVNNGFDRELCDYRSLHGILDYIWLIHDEKLSFSKQEKHELIANWVNMHLGDIINRKLIAIEEVQQINKLSHLVDMLIGKIDQKFPSVANDYRSLFNTIEIS